MAESKHYDAIPHHHATSWPARLGLGLDRAHAASSRGFAVTVAADRSAHAPAAFDHGELITLAVTRFEPLG